MTDLPIKGLEETIAVLSALPEKMQKSAVRKGLTAGAAVVRDEARFRAPRRSGKFAKSIKSGSSRRNQDGSYSIAVRVNDFRGVFFEYGVRPHYITGGDGELSPRLLTRSSRDGGASDAKSGALVIDGKFVSGAILHPGFAAKPFLRPALDIKSEEVVRAIAFEIEEFVFNFTGFQAAA